MVNAFYSIIDSTWPKLVQTESIQLKVGQKDQNLYRLNHPELKEPSLTNDVGTLDYKPRSDLN